MRVAEGSAAQRRHHRLATNKARNCARCGVGRIGAVVGLVACSGPGDG